MQSSVFELLGFSCQQDIHDLLRKRERQERYLRIIISGWQLKPPCHELLCQQAPLQLHGCKLLNTSLFLPNFLEEFMQSTGMLMWKLSTLSSRGQRSVWAVQAATALQHLQRLLPQPGATQQACWPQGANLASRF